MGGIFGSSKYAIDKAIAKLIDSAPETLDTLGEIAEAIEYTAQRVSSLESQADAGYPAPYVSKIEGGKIFQGLSKTIVVNGSFFTPDTTVRCAGLEIDSVEFINSHSFVLSVTASEPPGFYPVTIDNGNSTVVEDAVKILDPSSSIVDLRAGGTEFSDAAIQMRDGMSFNRGVNGITFSGSSIWASWARFVGDNNAWTWNRSEKKTISWIFAHSASFMIGIGSDENDPNSTTQYREAETLGFFTSETVFYGFYGNNGTPGQGVSQQYSFTYPSGVIKKLTIESNGEAGANFSLYQLPSDNLDDWLDTSNRIGRGVIAETFTADAPNIMPFVIPRDRSETRVLGFIFE